jgi:hypothetical protein
MNGSIRWIAIAFALGLCAAYALWGGGPHSGGPTIATPGPAAPAVTAPSTATATNAAITPNPIDPTMAKVGTLFVKFDPPALDYGDVMVGQSIEKTVTITNITPKPVHLGWAHGSCGCMKAALAAQDVAPGKSAEMKVTFTGLAGKRPESYHVEVGVDEAKIPALMDVKAKVLQIFSADPDKLQFGHLKKGERKTIVTTLSKLDGTPFKILNATATHKEIDLSMPEAVENSNGSKWRLSVTVTALRGARLIEQLMVLTDEKASPQIPLQIFAELDGEAVCTDEHISINIGTDGKAQPIETTIKRQTPGILVIEKVTDSEGGAVTFKVQKIDDSSVKLSMSLDTEGRGKRPFGELRIKTSVEEEPIHLPYNLPRKQGAGLVR